MSEGHSIQDRAIQGRDQESNGHTQPIEVSPAPKVFLGLRRVTVRIVLLQIIAAVAASLAGPFIPRVLEPFIIQVIDLFRTTGIPYQGRFTIELLVVLTSLGIGNLLYAFRYRWPALYGTIEIVVALASVLAIAHQLYSNEPMSPYFAPTLVELAALYIFVRGMDNIYRSFTPKSRRQQAWEKLYFGKVVTI
jgi:hypothetical protein